MVELRVISRSRYRAPLGALLAVVATAAVCAPVATPASAGAGRLSTSSRVTSAGRIGPLSVDRSDRAQVIAYAGQPNAERSAQSGGTSPYDALGYDCRVVGTISTAPLGAGGPYCQTVFYINEETGTLGTVFTAAHQYVEGRGLRVGTPTATAEKLLHKSLIAGCGMSIYLMGKTATLTIAFTGGHIHSPGLHVTGGHVYGFVLHSRHNDLGVFDCL